MLSSTEILNQNINLCHFRVEKYVNIKIFLTEIHVTIDQQLYGKIKKKDTFFQ